MPRIRVSPEFGPYDFSFQLFPASTGGGLQITGIKNEATRPKADGLFPPLALAK